MNDCAADRHLGGPPEPAAAHAWLCRSCRRHLTADLWRLPSLDARLERILVTAAATSARLHLGGGEGLPYNEAAAEARSQIRHDLGWWAREIGALRGMVPAWDSPDPVPAVAGWLAAQVRWVCYREQAGPMASVFAQLTGRAMGLLQPRIVKRFPLHAPCPDCRDGRLWACIYASPGDPRDDFVWCKRCGQEFPFWRVWEISRAITRLLAGELSDAG